MKRYCTVESYDGTVTAYTESEACQAAIESADCACWIWQYAESLAQAVEQHHEKHAAWESDQTANKPIKNTY